MWSELRNHALGPAQAAESNGVPDAAAADVFNSYFSNVGRRIAVELAERRVNPLPPRPPIVCSSTFVVRPATLPELSSALKRMSGSKATGCDAVTGYRCSWSDAAFQWSAPTSCA